MMATEAPATEVEIQSENNNNADGVTESVNMKLDQKPDDANQDTSDQPAIGDDEVCKMSNDEEVKLGDDDDNADDADNGDADNDDNDDDGEQNQDSDGNEDEKNETSEAGQDESMDDSEKTNLIVNYLPQMMTDEEFKALFTKFGAMKSCKIVRNRMTGYSYGFGFVDFETHEQAVKAIDELNGHELETKKIKVAFARPAGRDIKQANLYVKNIPKSWTQDDVRKAFESYGNIIQVRVLGNDRGVAFVLYDLRKQAEMALEGMQNKKLEGAEEPLEIKFAADKKSDKKRSRRGGRGRGEGGNNINADGTGTVRRERGNRGGVNRNRNRSQSDSRNRLVARGQRGNNDQRGNRLNNNSNNNNMNNSNNNGFGPVRQQTTARMNRFAPFAPVHQPAPIQQATPIAAYGYAQQPMYPYMMQQQQAAMMQFNPAAAAAAAAAQPMAAAAINPMGPYQMAAAAAAAGANAMAQVSYSAPAAQAMTNMYSMASNTLQNAAQMQPQLGQPMSNQMRGVQSAGSGGMNSGGGGGGGSSGDGVTLFVYNIGPQSDESELRQMFAPYGQVLRCNVVRKTPGGETKGFGFVTMKDKNQANAAISSLNGSPRNGKTLQVSLKK